MSEVLPGLWDVAEGPVAATEVAELNGLPLEARQLLVDAESALVQLDRLADVAEGFVAAAEVAEPNGLPLEAPELLVDAERALVQLDRLADVAQEAKKAKRLQPSASLPRSPVMCLGSP